MPGPQTNGQAPDLGYALDYVGEGVATLDREWRYTYLNRAAVEISGKSAEELIGNSVWEVFPAMIGTLVYHEFHRAAAERSHRHIEEYYPGVDRWMEVDIYPTDDGLIVIARDITGAKKRALEARHRDERLSLALSFGNMGVWEYDLKKDVIRWSPELEAIHGLAAGTFDGRYETVAACVHPEDYEGLREAFAHALQTRSVLAHEFRVIWPDGTVHHLYSRGKVVCDEDGAAELLLGVTVEITDRKLAARELRNKVEQLELLSELAGAVSRAQAPGEIYQAAAEGLVRAVGADRASVLIFDADDALRFKAWIGLSAE